MKITVKKQKAKPKVRVVLEVTPKEARKIKTSLMNDFVWDDTDSEAFYSELHTAFERAEYAE